MTEADPVVGNWYRHLDKGQEFLVVAVDSDEGVVEVQHFDGNVESFNFDEWYELPVEPTEAPENWTGAMGDTDADAMDIQIDVPTEDEPNWSEPLDEFHRSEQQDDEQESEWRKPFDEET